MDFKEIVSYTVAQARQELIAIFLQSAVIIGMSHYGLNILIYCVFATQIALYEGWSLQKS